MALMLKIVLDLCNMEFFMYKETLGGLLLFGKQ